MTVFPVESVLVVSHDIVSRFSFSLSNRSTSVTSVCTASESVWASTKPSSVSVSSVSASPEPSDWTGSMTTSKRSSCTGFSLLSMTTTAVAVGVVGVVGSLGRGEALRRAGIERNTR